jgi:chloride channel protein, CIC family
LARVSEAQRSPRRWSTPQPNITGLGIIASYSRRFWALLVLLGVITGLAAAALVGLLRLVERLAYGVHEHTLLASVEAAPHYRRVVALLVAAVVVVVGARILGRRPTGGTEVTEGIWLRHGELALIPSVARAALSIVTVGLGVSLGREAAPQLAGAATGSALAEWAKLPRWQRRLLVACGAGAGFGAVYNVPLGGTLLALEVMLGTLALPLVLPALLTSVTATAVAWIFLGTGSIYRVQAYPLKASELAFAVIMGPIIGVVAVGWTRLIAAANGLRPKRPLGRYVAPFVVFGALGLLSLQYPQLLGNGRGIVQLGIDADLSLGLLAVLLVLKPLVTAACVASGSPGGLFTPTLALGVLLAGVCGVLWGHVWHGAAPGSYALIGGAAFLAAAMQGPLTGIVVMMELANHFDALTVPTVVAVVEATILSRRLGAASIYSARLADGAVVDDAPVGNAAAAAAIHALNETLPAEFTGPPVP